ncbi:extracellular solute-binding protein [Paenibacillus sp. HB172176]|uniref:extracellular solute-binding protein n=1 Tax=Paenibacillus sp. HB172176 TaxID=2493690 RepID=UPI00143BC2C8|nr:extracellular solute-binding protein [Paenibacillus sp. HB172176]
MKKWSVSVLLLCCVVIAVIAGGCSSGNNNNANPPANTEGQEGTEVQPTSTLQGKTFSMLVETNPSWPYDANWPVWTWLKEATGVTLDVSVPAGKLAETVQLNVASGSMPDISMILSISDANKFGQQGAFANILDYMELMPHFKKWKEQYPEAFRSNLAPDGKMYMFPNQGFGETNRMSWLYREDVFKENGLQTPKTYDELYDVLKQLKAKYPDSYPLSFRMGKTLNSNMTKILAPNFGSSDTYYYNADTQEVGYGPTEDGYKSMVEYLNKFTAEGLIPPNWLTVDTKQWQDMMSTNKAFITFDYLARIDFFNAPMREENPDYTLAFMAPPAGPNGAQVNPFTSFLQSGMAVSSKAKDVESIMQYIDFFYSEEGQTLASWGKEGETYTTVDGQKRLNDDFADITDFRKKTGLSTHGTYTWIDYDAHLSLASDELKAAYEEAVPYDKAYQPIPSFTDEEQDVLSTVGEAVDKHREENIAKFIMGTRPLSEWEQYKSEADKLGLEQVKEIYKNAYERAAAAN